MKDDLISRQQAIDALKEKVFHNLSDEFYGAMQVLDELPSAQPTIKPRKGKWIYSREYGTAKIWTCSECGWNDIGEWNFCPNCGADMREVTE